jgi:hypothetical protein
MDPATRLYLVEVAEPDMHEPSGDLERLRALPSNGASPMSRAPAHAAGAPARAAQGQWKVTVAATTGTGAREVRGSSCLARLHEGSLYGLAIDLGSTTIAAISATCRRARCSPPPA